jgi:serine/threonine protein kinase
MAGAFRDAPLEKLLIWELPSSQFELNCAQTWWIRDWFAQCTDIYLQVKKMLQSNPSNRITAKDALLHPYFKDLPEDFLNTYKKWIFYGCFSLMVVNKWFVIKKLLMHFYKKISV